MSTTPLIVGSIPLPELKGILKCLRIAGKALPDPKDLCSLEHLTIAQTEDEVAKSVMGGVEGAQPAIVIATSQFSANVLQAMLDDDLLETGAKILQLPGNNKNEHPAEAEGSTSGEPKGAETTILAMTNEEEQSSRRRSKSPPTQRKARKGKAKAVDDEIATEEGKSKDRRKGGRHLRMILTANPLSEQPKATKAAAKRKRESNTVTTPAKKSTRRKKDVVDKLQPTISLWTTSEVTNWTSPVVKAPTSSRTVIVIEDDDDNSSSNETNLKVRGRSEVEKVGRRLNEMKRMAYKEDFCSLAPPVRLNKGVRGIVTSKDDKSPSVIEHSTPLTDDMPLPRYIDPQRTTTTTSEKKEDAGAIYRALIKIQKGEMTDYPPNTSLQNRNKIMLRGPTGRILEEELAKTPARYPMATNVVKYVASRFASRTKTARWKSVTLLAMVEASHLITPKGEQIKDQWGKDTNKVNYACRRQIPASSYKLAEDWLEGVATPLLHLLDLPALEQCRTADLWEEIAEVGSERLGWVWTSIQYRRLVEDNNTNNRWNPSTKSQWDKLLKFRKGGKAWKPTFKIKEAQLLPEHVLGLGAGLGSGARQVRPLQLACTAQAIQALSDPSPTHQLAIACKTTSDKATTNEGEPEDEDDSNDGESEDDETTPKGANINMAPMEEVTRVMKELQSYYEVDPNTEPQRSIVLDCVGDTECVTKELIEKAISDSFEGFPCFIKSLRRMNHQLILEFVEPIFRDAAICTINVWSKTITKHTTCTTNIPDHFTLPPSLRKVSFLPTLPCRKALGSDVSYVKRLLGEAGYTNTKVQLEQQEHRNKKVIVTLPDWQSVMQIFQETHIGKTPCRAATEAEVPKTPWCQTCNRPGHLQCNRPKEEWCTICPRLSQQLQQHFILFSKQDADQSQHPLLSCAARRLIWKVRALYWNVAVRASRVGDGILSMSVEGILSRFHDLKGTNGEVHGLKGPLPSIAISGEDEEEQIIDATALPSTSSHTT